MATIDDGELYLEIEGATEVQLRRGIAAARAVFESSGATIEAAFLASHARDNADDIGELDQLPQEEFERAFVVDEAWSAGNRAALPNYGSSPVNGDIGIYALVMGNRAKRSAMRAEYPDDGWSPEPDTGPHYHLDRATA